MVCGVVSEHQGKQLIMVQLLPDRERRHLLQFYFFPKWDYYVRLAWAGGLIGVGLLLQLLWMPSSSTPILLLTLPLLLVGTLLLLVRGFNLKPAGQLHEGEWEKTTGSTATTSYSRRRQGSLPSAVIPSAGEGCHRRARFGLRA